MENYIKYWWRTDEKKWPYVMHKSSYTLCKTEDLSWVGGADRKVCLRVTVWHHEAVPRDAKQWSRGTDFFVSATNNHDRFFFLHTFRSPEFGKVEVAINKSRSFTLTSAILEVEVVCDVTMTSTPNVGDLLYNQCIDNTCCYSIFIYLTSRIRVCKIRFVSTG